ncbi:hypothetical protein K458DRAFT_417584 [Lentithecium fluviatile CBS 122367]|uniref:Mid2 domain-containing protein n=1 Tax=Lentithecium fluviatile CBS 122367 TaxID=1168545 RepID=A0A6G1J3A7_9PLEO|nr:hypothetical protein K458DRAFT_417584 [Lentithecium fluviatile CBS 122367]
MGPLAGVPKLSRLSLLFLIATTLPSAQASHLLLRQAQTCGGDSSLQQCGGDLPASFCCGSDKVCTRVNTTDIQSVVCCPKGQDCSAIQPVPCDVSLYNATLHPDNQIHIANTSSIELPTCGTSCCPLGYACNGGMCSLSKAAPSPTSASPSPSSTNPASASQTSGCAAPTTQSSSGFDGKSFAAGFFPGIVIGALGVLGLMWIIKKRREADKNRYSGDFGHVARTISDPIYDPMHAARVDFIRRGSQSVSSTPTPQKAIGTKAAGGGGGGGGLTPKIKSMWDRTPKLGGFSGWSGLPSNPAPPPPAVRAGDRDPYRTPGQTPPRTTSRRVSKSKRPLATRSTSTETIDVLMPAPSFLEPPKALGMRENRLTQDSCHTTFTKLMERAGYGVDTQESVRNFSSPGRAR